MKMAELVEKDFHLLTLCARLGIDRSFGEQTVESLCRSCEVDPDTFLLLCQVYSDPLFRPTVSQLRPCRVEDVLEYLHRSHDYYLDEALPRLSDGIEALTQPCTEGQKQVIRRFLADFRHELEHHFASEEQSVIPNHTQIHETLSDVKNLILKSLPEACDPRLRREILLAIYTLQHDIDRHTCIEDEVLVPLVRLQNAPRRVLSEPEEPEREELTIREKEILVSVAQGLLNKEIADKHNISINTVITHRKNITRKTGIKTVAGLTAYAILNDLIDINSIE
jgi:regulator of cell morphogenesis and NO signaling